MIKNKNYNQKSAFKKGDNKNRNSILQQKKLEKGLFLIVESLNIGKKIIGLFSEKNTVQDIILKIHKKENFNPQNIQQSIENITKIFLSQTEYFGQIDLQNFYGFKADFIEDFFSPRKLHIQNEIFIDNKRFISSAVVIRKIEENYFLQDHNEVKKQNGKKDAESDQVLAFTIVLMIENNFDNLQFQDQFYKHQLSFFARCLELEERKNNLLGKQLTKIFKQNMEFSQYVKDLSTNEQIKEIIQNQINNNVEDTQLFKNLQEWIIKKIHDKQLQQKQTIELYKDFCEKLANQIFSQNGSISINPQLKLVGQIQYQKIKIKPYQTLILSKSTLEKDFGADCSLRLKKFIEVLNPKQNFETLGMANNFSLEEIEVYVNHILQWKQGVVMNILTQYSVLILKPRMKKSSLQKVIEGLMKQQEDNIDIYGSITNFLVPKIVKEHSKELGISGDSMLKLIRNMIINQLLVETNIYIYSKTRGQIDEKQKKAMTILSGLDGNIVEILNRYANKQVHLNEIAFNEKVKIQDLQKVIFHSEAQNVFQVYYLED